MLEQPFDSVVPLLLILQTSIRNKIYFDTYMRLEICCALNISSEREVILKTFNDFTLFSIYTTKDM